MKKFIIAIAFFCVLAFGQEEELPAMAVYVTGEDQEIAPILAAELLTAIVNSGEYRAVERSGEFLAQMRKEQNYQRSGSVSDAQIKKLGEQFGAAFVCVAQISIARGDYYIQARIVNIESGQPIATSRDYGNLNTMTEIVQTAESIAEKLLGISAGSKSKKKTAKKSNGSLSNGDVYNPDGIEMVWVEGEGAGIMKKEGFFIGKYEVMQEQWKAVMGNNPSNFSGGRNPVEKISWNDVKEFISKLNSFATGCEYRLPKETEWEYAARGGSLHENFEYSGSNNIGEVAWYDGNSGNVTHTVGTKKPNGLGIYDMSGNVWEWVEDCYDNSCSYRVIRGGSWNDIATLVRVALRYDISPSIRNYYIGFRLACNLK